MVKTGVKQNNKKILKETKIMLISVTVNIILSLIKIISGVLFKTGVLIADGLHSFSDLTTDFVAIFGNIISKKPADNEHPYGHGRGEYLTNLIIGTIIIIMGLMIIYSSYSKNAVIPTIYVFVVTIITIICKYFLSKYVIHEGKKLNNTVIISSGKESGADVISSIFVLISVGLMHLSKYYKIFEYADMVGMIIVALFIIKVGYDILKENVSTLLGEQIMDENYIDKIKQFILKDENIKKIDHFFFLKYGPYNKLIIEITISHKLTINQTDKIIKTIKRDIKNFDEKIKYIIVQISSDT